MRAMEKATGKTSVEITKMMEQGQLGIDVLPKFGEALREMARDNNGLAEAIKTARVQENRMIMQTQKAGDTIFKSGFSEGLMELYKTIADMLSENERSLKKIGKIFGAIFKTIAYTLKALEPVMRVAIEHFELLVGGAAIYKLSKFIAAVKTGSYVMQAAWMRAFAPLAAGILLLEEALSLVDDSRVGILEAQMGKQINLNTGTAQDIEKRADGKFYAKGDVRQGEVSDKGLFRLPMGLMGDFYKWYGSQAVNIYNSFFNENADEMKRIQEMQISNAGKSNTK